MTEGRLTLRADTPPTYNCKTDNNRTVETSR